MTDPLCDWLQQALERRPSGGVVWLVGAGLSAESGIPTFRGSEGYWRQGSRNYTPMELATWATFRRDPELVWAWYLHRLSVCRAAKPNAAHRALAELARDHPERILVVTQNVDALHRRAGHPEQRLYEIHGCIERARCAEDCDPEPLPMPPDWPEHWPRGRALDDEARRRLRCPRCGGWLRPHVLWFDECYDEPRYRFDSSLRAVAHAAVLLVVGTSGATTLPQLMVSAALRSGVPVLVVDLERTVFATMAEASGMGRFLQGTATQRVPEICSILRRKLG